MDHFFIIVKGHFAYKHERNCIFNNTKDVSDVRGYVFVIVIKIAKWQQHV